MSDQFNLNPRSITAIYSLGTGRIEVAPESLRMATITTPLWQGRVPVVVFTDAATGSEVTVPTSAVSAVEGDLVAQLSMREQVAAAVANQPRRVISESDRVVDIGVRDDPDSDLVSWISVSTRDDRLELAGFAAIERWWDDVLAGQNPEVTATASDARPAVLSPGLVRLPVARSSAAAAYRWLAGVGSIERDRANA